MTHEQIAHVSFPAGPAPRLIIRTEMIRLSSWGKAMVPGRVEREAIATLRLKTGWHGPFWDDVPLLYMETGLTGPSAVGRKACFHFGSTTQRLALTKAYVDGVFTTLNRHPDLLVIVLCFTDTSQVTEESRPIDRFDLLAVKYQAFDRRPLRRYVRELRAWPDLALGCIDIPEAYVE